jgi:hypothetical protein
MTQTFTLFLNGTMTAREPITVTHKDAQVGKQHRLPRAGKGENAQPYWPSSNIRGAFRHCMNAVVAAAAEANGQKLKLEHHMMIAQGTDIEGVIGDTEGIIDAHKEIRAANPALSVLGRWKLPSKIGVGNAFPLNNDCFAMYGQGARRIMFEVDPELVDDLEDSDQKRLKDLLAWQTEASESKTDIKSQIRDLTKKLKSSESPAEKNVLRDQIEALNNAQTALNKGEMSEGATGIRRPLPGYEAFNAGTKFSQSITLNNVTKVEAGLFIAALVKFSRSPFLGAKNAYNNGKVDFEWDVSRYADDISLTPDVTGNFIMNSETGIEINDDLMNECYEAWLEASKDFASNGIDMQKLA